MYNPKEIYNELIKRIAMAITVQLGAILKHVNKHSPSAPLWADRARICAQIFHALAICCVLTKMAGGYPFPG